MKVEVEECTGDLTGLEEKNLKTLADWVRGRGEGPADVRTDWLLVWI